MRDYEKTLFEAAGVEYPPDAEQVWRSINKNDSIIDLRYAVEEYISDVYATVDELLGLVDSIVNSAASEKTIRACLDCVNRALHELGDGSYDNLSSSVSALRRLLLNGEGNLSQADHLSTGTLATLWFPGEALLEVYFDGILSPARGSSDSIFVRIRENGIENPDCLGFIRKDYADIRLNDDTYVEPTQSDELEVEIQVLLEFVNDRIEKAGNFFRKVLVELRQL